MISNSPPRYIKRAGVFVEVTQAEFESFKATHRRSSIDPRVSASKVTPAQPLGLGDQVAKLAQPIARAIDAALGTKIANCGACKQRQAALNALVPDVSRPLARPIPARGTPSAR